MSDLTPSSRGGVAPGKQMTILEHLQELRNRMLVAMVAVIAGLGASAAFGGEIIDFLKEPAEDQLSGFQLQFVEPFELFVTYFRVSLLAGLVGAMPIITYQGLRFLAPGLKEGEKRWIYATVLGGTLLFLGGAAFSFFIILPRALDFLLNFGSDLADPNIRIGSYIDFVTRLIFWTGVSFETPLIVMFLARLGVVTASQLLRWWRVAVVVAFAISAIVTPTIDPITQSFVAGPIVVLYFLGVLLAWIMNPRAGAKASSLQSE